MFYTNSVASTSGRCTILSFFLSGLVMRAYQIKIAMVARMMIPTMTNAFMR